MTTSVTRPSPTPSSTGSSTMPTASPSQVKACGGAGQSRNHLTKPARPDSMQASTSLARDREMAAHDGVEHVPEIA